MGALAHNLHVVAPGNWKLLLLDPGQWCANISSILKYLMITHFEAVLLVENYISNRIMQDFHVHQKFLFAGTWKLFCMLTHFVAVFFVKNNTSNR